MNDLTKLWLDKLQSVLNECPLSEEEKGELQFVLTDWQEITLVEIDLALDDRFDYQKSVFYSGFGEDRITWNEILEKHPRSILYSLKTPLIFNTDDCSN